MALAVLQSTFARFYSESCSQIYFEQHDFLDATCLKFFVSKSLGYAIIAGAVVLKVPQILKIFPSGNITGLSVASFILSCIGYTITFAYNQSHGYPFSTYGENVFLVIQDLIIIALLLYYSNLMGVHFFGFAIAYVAIVAWLFSGTISPALFASLQSATIVIFSASKVPQIWSNFQVLDSPRTSPLPPYSTSLTLYPPLQASSTGSLSLATTFLQFAGAGARVFTTLQEVDDQAVLANFLIGLALNGVLFAQMLWYWGAKTKTKAE